MFSPSLSFSGSRSFSDRPILGGAALLSHNIFFAFMHLCNPVHELRIRRLLLLSSPSAQTLTYLVNS